jgi:hypothetical protein
MARSGPAGAGERTAAKPRRDIERGPEIVVRVDRRRGVFTAVAAVVVLVALLFTARTCDLLAGQANPFRERTTDRSQPVLLESIQDLSRYEAAAANLQVVIDLERDARFIPSAIYGERTLFVAAGTVDAYVDFAGLGDKALTVSDDRRAVRVRLPRPALEKPNLDHDRSYVFSRQQGIVNKFQSMIDDDSNRLQKLYQVAEKKLTTAADQSGLKSQAERNARAMLEGLLKSLGFTTVTVEFAGP